MTTTTEALEDANRCPFCGNNIDKIRLGRLGLSDEELQVITEHVRDGTLKNLLTVAEIAVRRLDPEKMNIESQVNIVISRLRETTNNNFARFMNDTKAFLGEIFRDKEEDKIRITREYEQKHKGIVEASQKDLLDITKGIERLQKDNRIDELIQNVREVREKIVGTGIGNVSEMVTILELKGAVPTDAFSETRASKGGTDIIATVKENITICGTITISNKCTQKWESQFLSQLTRDMKDDGSRFGILVTKAFPREALSAKVWIVDVQEGKTVVLAKPEYAPVCYVGLREAAIHWYNTQTVLKRKEEEADESQKTFTALMAWINGEEFGESIRYIDEAQKTAEETRNLLANMRNYIDTQVDKATRSQNSIERALIHAKSLIGNLRELLNSGSSNHFS